MLTEIYLFISSLVFLFLFVAWSKEGFANVLVKCNLLVLFLYGVFVGLSYTGYVIKISQG